MFMKHIAEFGRGPLGALQNVKPFPLCLSNSSENWSSFLKEEQELVVWTELLIIDCCKGPGHSNYWWGRMGVLRRAWQSVGKHSAYSQAIGFQPWLRIQGGVPQSGDLQLWCCTKSHNSALGKTAWKASPRISSTSYLLSSLKVNRKTHVEFSRKTKVPRFDHITYPKHQGK